MAEVIGEVISCVKLDARLVGEHFEASASAGVVNNSSGLGFDRLIMVVSEHHAVIIAACDVEGFVIRLDVFADELRAREVHRGFINRTDFPSWYHASISRQEIIGMNLNLVVGDRGVEFAAEIPVGVIDNVNHGGLVRRCLGMPTKFVVVIEPVGDRHIKVARVSFISIGGVKRESHAMTFSVFE